MLPTPTTLPPRFLPAGAQSHALSSSLSSYSPLLNPVLVSPQSAPFPLCLGFPRSAAPTVDAVAAAVSACSLPSSQPARSRPDLAAARTGTTPAAGRRRWLARRPSACLAGLGLAGGNSWRVPGGQCTQLSATRARSRPHPAPSRHSQSPPGPSPSSCGGVPPVAGEARATAAPAPALVPAGGKAVADAAGAGAPRAAPVRSGRTTTARASVSASRWFPPLPASRGPWLREVPQTLTQLRAWLSPPRLPPPPPRPPTPAA